MEILQKLKMDIKKKEAIIEELKNKYAVVSNLMNNYLPQ